MILAHGALAAAFGGSVGVVEIMQRYRSDPWGALTTAWGAFYVLTHATAAGAAWWICLVSDTVTEATSGYDLLQWAAVCGFGAAAFLRSKLLDVRTRSGSTVAVGPDIVIQTLLAALDRSIDAHQATQRIQDARRLMHGHEYDAIKTSLPLRLIASMQAMEDAEVDALRQRLDEVDAASDVQGPPKSELLGLVLLHSFSPDLIGRTLEEVRAK